jgi:ATP-binding cassette subfamily B protein
VYQLHRPAGWQPRPVGAIPLFRSADGLVLWRTWGSLIEVAVRNCRRAMHFEAPVDTPAFNRLYRDFLKSPVEKWGAILSSIGAAITYLLLLLVLYLFVDLLVYRGEIPAFAQLSVARQREFADEWSARPESERDEAVRRLSTFEPLVKRVAADQQLQPPPTANEWELRWRAGVYLSLRDRVGPAAAAAYLPDQAVGEQEEPHRLGVLSLVARNRNRWTGQFLGWLASWNGWMWRPGLSGNPNVTYLTGLFFIAFAIAAVRGVLVNALTYLAAAATLDIVTRLRRALYLHTFRLGSLAIRTGGTSEPVDLFIKKTEAVGSAVQAWLTTRFSCPILVIGLLVLILLVHFWLAVSFLLLALLVWVIGGQIAAHFRREGRVGARQAAAALDLLTESLGLIRLVKCYQMERFNQNRVERQLAESGRAHWRKLRGYALSGPLLTSVALIAGVALCYLAGRSILAGDFTVAGLTVMAVALVSLAPPIGAWFEARVRLRRGGEAADAIAEFLERRGETAEAVDAEYLPPLTTRMEFRNVTLNEPGTGRHLLDSVSFAIPAGASVALVGSDPIEKRSLAYLIPRFLDPTSGEIRIEDKNIKWVTHESLRTQVALVMQDDWAFTDTVANNIGVGDPQYNLPQIIEAAKLAHAHQFIEKLPYGYETVVGQHGRTLSPGEQFRLALARALLRDPSIVIIEEPTGLTDEDTLALLDDTLERASHGRTIIFLASRLSTLRKVDRIFLLKDGRLEASGTHRELWQTNEYYRRLPIVADATPEHATLKE